MTICIDKIPDSWLVVKQIFDKISKVTLKQGEKPLSLTPPQTGLLKTLEMGSIGEIVFGLKIKAISDNQ